MHLYISICKLPIISGKAFIGNVEGIKSTILNTSHYFINGEIQKTETTQVKTEGTRVVTSTIRIWACRTLSTEGNIKHLLSLPWKLKEQSRKSESSRDHDDDKETIFWTEKDNCTHKFPVTVTSSTKLLQAQNGPYSSVKKGARHRVPLLVVGLWASADGRGENTFLWVQLLSSWPWSTGRPHIQEYFGTQICVQGFGVFFFFFGFVFLFACLFWTNCWVENRVGSRKG